MVNAHDDRYEASAESRGEYADPQKKSAENTIKKLFDYNIHSLILSAAAVHSSIVTIPMYVNTITVR